MLVERIVSPVGFFAGRRDWFEIHIHRSVGVFLRILPGSCPKHRDRQAGEASDSKENWHHRQP